MQNERSVILKQDVNIADNDYDESINGPFRSSGHSQISSSLPSSIHPAMEGNLFFNTHQSALNNKTRSEEEEEEEKGGVNRGAGDTNGSESFVTVSENGRKRRDEGNRRDGMDEGKRRDEGNGRDGMDGREAPQLSMKDAIEAQLKARALRGIVNDKTTTDTITDEMRYSRDTINTQTVSGNGKNNHTGQGNFSEENINKLDSMLTATVRPEVSRTSRNGEQDSTVKSAIKSSTQSNSKAKGDIFASLFDDPHSMFSDELNKNTSTASTSRSSSGRDAFADGPLQSTDTTMKECGRCDLLDSKQLLKSQLQQQLQQQQQQQQKQQQQKKSKSTSEQAHQRPAAHQGKDPYTTSGAPQHTSSNFSSFPPSSYSAPQMGTKNLDSKIISSQSIAHATENSNKNNEFSNQKIPSSIHPDSTVSRDVSTVKKKPVKKASLFDDDPIFGDIPVVKESSSKPTSTSTHATASTPSSASTSTLSHAAIHSMDSGKPTVDFDLGSKQLAGGFDHSGYGIRSDSSGSKVGDGTIVPIGGSAQVMRSVYNASNAINSSSTASTPVINNNNTTTTTNTTSDTSTSTNSVNMDSENVLEENRNSSYLKNIPPLSANNFLPLNPGVQIPQGSVPAPVPVPIPSLGVKNNPLKKMGLKSKSLFEDDDDDNNNLFSDFSSTNIKSDSSKNSLTSGNAASKEPSLYQSKKSNSLFGDDDDEDVFRTSIKNASNSKTKKSSEKLFDD